ncbi:MAG: NAD(P)H-hydrate dehydratase [Planctomycetota bacterium]
MRAEHNRILLTSSAMAAADRRTIEEFGLPSFTLMEVAARGVTDAVVDALGDAAIDQAAVLVLAGKGNNGGDGLAVARQLHERGADVFVVVLSGAADGSPETQLNLSLLERLGDVDPSQGSPRDSAVLVLHRFDESLPIESENARVRAAAAEWGPIDVCVDGLLGIGARGALRDPVRSLAELAAQARLVVAIDIATGIDSDTGERQGGGVHADHTVTMAATKPGHWLGAGPRGSGEVHVVDIGIPGHMLASALAEEGCATIAGEARIRELLARMPRGEHKFQVGQAAIVAGSNRFSGALILAARAACRVGAGYVVAATTERAATALDAQLPEVVALSFRAAEGGTLPGGAAPALKSELMRARAVLIGPGLGYGLGDAPRVEIASLVGSLVSTLDVPLVLDADGLNALDTEDALASVARRKAATVLTPHPGEFARLKKAALAGREDERGLLPTSEAARWAKRLNSVLVLKGTPTIIASPDGRTFVAPESHPALRTAGSGDVLAGMITGLLAQGLEALDAAVVAMHLGLAAADRACEQRDPESVVASDVLECVRMTPR